MSEVAVLGVGMHPWGKWGKPFTEYGVAHLRVGAEVELVVEPLDDELSIWRWKPVVELGEEADQ